MRSMCIVNGKKCYKIYIMEMKAIPCCVCLLRCLDFATSKNSE